MLYIRDCEIDRLNIKEQKNETAYSHYVYGFCRDYIAIKSNFRKKDYYKE